MEGYDLDHEYEVLRYEVNESVALAKSHGSSQWKALFTKTNLRRMIVATLPFTFQNFVGVSLIFGYTTYFFQLAKLKDPFLGKVIINLVLVGGIFSSFYWVDKAGRRTLVLYGGVIMGSICCIVGGLGFIEQTTASGTGLITLCAAWAFVYANSLAPIGEWLLGTTISGFATNTVVILGWTSLVEVSSPALRAKTTACAAIIQALSNLVFVSLTQVDSQSSLTRIQAYCVPMMLSNQYAGWGQKTGLFFAGITFVYLIPLILMFPETKGRTYNELDELFESGIPAWKFAKARTTHQNGIEQQKHQKEQN